MTAVVYDGTTIAADRLIVAGPRISGYRKKLVTFKEGVFGWSGNLVDAEGFRRYLDGEAEEGWKPNKDFQALVYTTGKVYEYLDDLTFHEAFSPTGIGSGGGDAEVLVRTGWTAKDAVREVSKWVLSVGGPVDVIKVK